MHAIVGTACCQRRHRSVNCGRPTFILQGPIILGMMLLGFVVFVGVMSLFTGVIQSAIIESLTEVHTMYAYDADGGRISGSSADVQAAADPLLAERDVLEAERNTPMAGDGADYDRLVAVEADIDRVNGELREAGWSSETGTIISRYRFFALPVAAYERRSNWQIREWLQPFMTARWR